MKVSSLRPQSRKGFTLVELLVVIAIIGTLVGLLLPAVQQARESASRTSCASRIRQLAQGVNNYADAFQGQLPNSYRPNNGTARISWVTRVLPYIEQKALADKWDLSKNWSDTTTDATHPYPNAVLAATKIDILLCPSAPSSRADGDPDTGSTPAGYPTTNTNAVVNSTQTGFSTTGLFCAPTDYSPITFVDQRLANGGTISDNLADVAHNAAQGAQKAGLADGLMPKDYNGTVVPRLSECVSGDGLSNTIMLCESAGRPFQYIGGKKADDSTASFPARRVNGGGWCRPASDFAFDGSSPDGKTFGTGSNVTVAVNGTNGESVETGTYKGAIYGTEGTGEPYAFHPGGVNVAFGDGTVRMISKNCTIRVFASLVTRAGGENVVDKKSAGF